mmetsp:Transcript_50656/g.120629  ORF Transcript_50656/g.120629 Transcript_50656/m.120629 type:complete len:258 (-) Transcript_50656:281-1054(-)
MRRPRALHSEALDMVEKRVAVLDADGVVQRALLAVAVLNAHLTFALGIRGVREAPDRRRPLQLHKRLPPHVLGRVEPAILGAPIERRHGLRVLRCLCKFLRDAVPKAFQLVLPFRPPPRALQVRPRDMHELHGRHADHGFVPHVWGRRACRALPSCRRQPPLRRCARQAPAEVSGGVRSDEIILREEEIGRLMHLPGASQGGSGEVRGEARLIGRTLDHRSLRLAVCGGLLQVSGEERVRRGRPPLVPPHFAPHPEG